MTEGSRRFPAHGHLWPPPLGVLAVAVGSFCLYNASPPAVANVAIVPYAGALMCGPVIIYPWLRWRGGSVWQATVASLCVPVLWLVKESYMVGTVFSVWEAVFFAFNPVFLGFFTWVALQMAVSEIVLRRVWRGRWDVVSGAGLVCAAVAGLWGVFLAVGLRHDAAAIFWAYITLYRRLFGE